MAIEYVIHCPECDVWVMTIQPNPARLRFDRVIETRTCRNKHKFCIDYGPNGVHIMGIKDSSKFDNK